MKWMRDVVGGGRLAAVAVATVAVVGCSPAPEVGKADAGTTDASATDATATDSAGADGIATDTAAKDAATTDSAVTDAASSDVPSTDVNGVDAVTDAAVSDAGLTDAASADTQNGDSENADVANVDADPDAGADASDTTAATLVVVPAAAGLPVNVLDKTSTLTVTLTVVDPNGQPVPNADVLVGGISTPINGTAATLTGIAINASPVVTVRAPGFASTALVLDPLRALNGPTVVLKPFEATTTFPAALGGTLTTTAATITLADGGVVGPGGAPYTGPVTVSAAGADLARDLLDPVSGVRSDASANLPDPFVSVGAASGTDNAVSLKLASTYVALTGSAGEKLQPAPGKPAQVAFKLGSALSGALPGAYTVGAQLDVASRDETTGQWKTSSQCTVSKSDAGWTCSGSLPHFSEAAVVEKQKQGCLVVDDISLSVPADKSVTWRSQRLIGPLGLPVSGHFYNNGGKMGVCAIVPMNIENVALETVYQTGPVGAPVTPNRVYGAGVTTSSARMFLGIPADLGLDKLPSIDNTSADGCLATCQGAGPVQAAFAFQPPPPVSSLPPPAPLPPEPTPAVFEVVDFAAVDLDKDGVPAAADCDDTDPARAPGKVDTCGDGIDQDCDGKDALCGISCATAYGTCMQVCLGSDITPTAKEVACVAACPVTAPFNTPDDGQKWSAFQSCVGGCTDATCVQTTCGSAINACTATSSGTCAQVAPCQFGCLPLSIGGFTALYNSCVSACPVPSPTVIGQLTDLSMCAASACDTQLGTCAATEQTPTSSCQAADMGCFAGIPACSTAYAACFQP